MIKGINISHVWVFDQDEALDFYVGKLGLEVSADVDLGPMRWLTVRPKGQPDREILLELVAPPSVDPDAAEKVRQLVAKGAITLSAATAPTSSTGISTAGDAGNSRYVSAASSSATPKRTPWYGSGEPRRPAGAPACSRRCLRVTAVLSPRRPPRTP